MSGCYKEIKNGRGTNLTIAEDSYISVGQNGNDVTIRGAGKVMGFDTWEQFISSINKSNANYVSKDKEGSTNE